MPGTRGFVRQTELKKRLPYLYDFQRAIDYLLRAYVTGRRTVDDETRIDDRDGVLVVFVDDLDRCPSDRVVQVLETYLHFVSGAIERNPREVKRFVSSFAIQRSLAEARGLLRPSNPDAAAPPRLGVMDEELLAKWTALEFAFEPFVQSVRQRPSLIVQMQEEIKRQRAAKGSTEAPGAAGHEPPTELREFLTSPRLTMLLGAGKEFPGDIETINWCQAGPPRIR